MSKYYVRTNEGAYLKSHAEFIDEVAPKYPVEVAMEIGNAIKYLLRAPFKGRLIQDLNKANWYINRAIRNLETES